MRETIVIQLGNRGANIGSSFWRQISVEHGIENHLLAQQQSINNQKIEKSYNSFFYEQNEGQIVPRSVIVDLGSSVGDDTPFLEYPDYNNPGENHIVFNNRTYGKLNSEETSQIESAIRKQIERCDGLGQCMFIRDSTEDTSHIISDIELSDIGLGRKNIHDIFIVADRKSTDDQIINTALSYELFASYYPTRVIYQDSAIQRQVHSKNQRSKIDLNRFVAKTLSNLTYSDRVSNYWGISLSEMSHFDPYPGINLTVPSFVTTFDAFSMSCEIDPAPQSIFENAIYNSSLLCDVDFNVGYYMRAHFFARGFFGQEVNQSVKQLKDRKKIKFVSWCPTGFKVGTDNYMNPDLFKLDDKSVCGAFLNSSVVSIFELWNSRIEEITPRAVQSLLARKNIDIVDQAKAIKERILDFNEIEQAELAEDDSADVYV